MKTSTDVEQLKRGWLEDPCWDLEHAEGFESFADELKEFRLNKEAEWEIKWQLEFNKRLEKMGLNPSNEKNVALGSHILYLERENERLERRIDRLEARIDRLEG